jgi:hypothetical protein
MAGRVNSPNGKMSGFDRSAFQAGSLGFEAFG